MLSFVVGKMVTREEMGLPRNWEEIAIWYEKPFQFGFPDMPPFKKKRTKWDGVDFGKRATASFWNEFKKQDLPSQPTTSIKIPVLEGLSKKVGGRLTIHQKEGVAETIKNLTEGAPSHQLTELKGGFMRNASSASEHGATFTEVLATWLEKGFVAGPFITPPLKEFRANSLMAEVQRGKVRPILNMSYPNGDSFNDNVDKEAVP